MELNQIKLNNNLITTLYSTHLIEEEKFIENNNTKSVQATLPGNKAIPEFEYKQLGTNAKHILIVINYQETAFLPDAHLNFLTKIISACKISIADVAIINFHSYDGKTFDEIITHFKSKTVLLFGLSPKEFGMPIQFPFYQVQSFNKTTFLSSPGLEELTNNDVEKRKLWDGMKQLFSIK